MNKKTVLCFVLAGSMLLSGCNAASITPSGNQNSLVPASSSQVAASPAASSADFGAPSSVNSGSFAESANTISTSLDFLTEEQQDLYEKAVVAALPLFGLADNVTNCFGFKYASSDGKFVDRVDNKYDLYENSYQSLADIMYDIFTEEFLSTTNYNEKFVDHNGFLAVDSSIDGDNLVEGCSREALDNYPDTYRLGSKTDTEVTFTLISHYDKNWNNSSPLEIFTIEYPIRFIQTDSGWRVDEFHITIYG